MKQRYLVVTSINPPNEILRKLSEGALKHSTKFILVGDTKSPPNFELENCHYLSPQAQSDLPFKLARVLPWKHYSRKNIGYLQAIKEGAACIIETDDDNYPHKTSFWDIPKSTVSHGDAFYGKDWINVFRYFYGDSIWPRGFPLAEIHTAQPNYFEEIQSETLCPIWQGLADQNPDVDAIYRLTGKLPRSSTRDENLYLGQGSWCPFNSQNTKWLPEAYPLLYLPSTCSFRMTDIWRSYIAQVIAQNYGWLLAFTNSTVIQERNEHNLIDDFSDEVVGYLSNTNIIDSLKSCLLSDQPSNISEDLRIAYQTLIESKYFAQEELTYLDSWIKDLKNIDTQ